MAQKYQALLRQVAFLKGESKIGRKCGCVSKGACLRPFLTSIAGQQLRAINSERRRGGLFHTLEA
jgi:hypothetical protein